MFDTWSIGLWFCETTIIIKMTVAGTTTVKFQKRVSGTYNALYILRGGLYTNLTHTFIYFVATLYIGEKYESKQRNWYNGPMAHLLRNGWQCRLWGILRTQREEPKIISESGKRQSFIKSLGIGKIEVKQC